MGSFFIPIIALLGTMIFSRTITERAMKYLSQEQKADLVDIFKSQRTTGLVAILIIIGLYFGIVSLELLSPMAYTTIYVVVVIVFIGFQGFQARKKLAEHNFPIEYQKAHTQSTIFRALGVVLFIILLVTS